MPCQTLLGEETPAVAVVAAGDVPTAFNVIENPGQLFQQRISVVPELAGSAALQ